MKTSESNRHTALAIIEFDHVPRLRPGDIVRVTGMSKGDPGKIFGWTGSTLLSLMQGGEMRNEKLPGMLHAVCLPSRAWAMETLCGLPFGMLWGAHSFATRQSEITCAECARVVAECAKCAELRCMEASDE